METKEIRRRIAALGKAPLAGLRGKDFLRTWDKDVKELEGLLEIARLLREIRRRGLSARLWDQGLAVSQFRDNSTRTRFSFASACNLLGLAVQDLDEGKSQIAHGETVRETSVMVSFLTEVIGIRDDMYIGKGHEYMKAVADALEEAHREGVIDQRPTIVNLQCDEDHPTQSMADLLHAAGHFGGIGNLAGRKIAMSWAYSPSYGKPLSVPQGVIALFTRFGMHVTLAYPEGYSLMPDVVGMARDLAVVSGGSFRIAGSMAEAFEGADIVYPKSWAPFAVMQERTRTVETGDREALAALEKRCLEHNARFKEWQCTEAMMKRTADALYLHCLPADITGVNCGRGEVSGDVFDRFRVPLYRQAGWKPYVIAAMILGSRAADPAKALEGMLDRAEPRGRWTPANPPAAASAGKLKAGKPAAPKKAKPDVRRRSR
jgi:knotted carbamoyltransferase YgeW